ncbi:MAG TPA: ABC transporter permease [Anaerolineales bacterium]|nr:ABC transporter permease [Anaerolineales bacterium]
MAVAELGAQDILARPREVSQLELVWGRFSKHKLAVVGVWVLIGLFVASFAGPLFSPYDPEAQFVGPIFGDLTAANPFGTDDVGRDVMTRLMYAGRISLLLALVVTVASSAIGVVVGAVSGYFGGWVDALAMRLVDFMLTLPILPLLLIMSAMSIRGGLPIAFPEPLTRLFGWIWDMTPERAEGVLILAVILIAFQWQSLARLVRGQVLALRAQAYSEAAQALGASSLHIIARHMIPNSLAPIIVATTFNFGGVIITEAALSFVGFGVQAPSASWGSMLNGVRDFIMLQPWRAFVPGLAIFLASMSINFIGDALRDALDPRLKL